MGLWWRKLWRHHRRSQGIHLQVVGQKFQVSTDLPTLYLAETAATLCDCTNCIALLTVLKQNQKLSLPPLSKVNLSAHANLNHFLDFCRFCRVTVQATHSLGSSKNQTDGIVTRQLSVLFETFWFVCFRLRLSFYSSYDSHWFVSAPNATYYKSHSIDSGPISELSLASLYQSAVKAQSFI